MTRCRYCHRDHDPRLLCRGVSRRAFFFFGAAAAVAAVAPTLALYRPSALDELRVSEGLGGLHSYEPAEMKAEIDAILSEIRGRVPIDTGAFRRSINREVDPVLTQISLGYNPGGPDYALTIQESADGRHWSTLDKPSAASYRFIWERT